jgi:tetratricopeptide (TPR) repeat protein
MDYSDKTVRAGLICVLLGGLTLGVFWPVMQCEFTNFDDPYYVTANPNVLGGLTLENIGWAFRTGYYANWHPLTWLSHMADIELFGGHVGGHHLTSLLFHTANTLLLFWVLNLMTGALGRSALVAALFAVHPLHVESVAWISERKDVLSTCFFMLTIWAYWKYVQSPRSKVQSQGTEDRGQKLEDGRQKSEASVTQHATRNTQQGLRSTLHAPRFYVLSLFFFALGLMSKPMLVTLPFVLLLLDYWPLGRLKLPWFEVESSMLDVRCSEPPASCPAPSLLHSPTPILRLVLEKAPFFVLAIISSVITYIVQKQGGTTVLLGHIPLSNRLGNAFIAYLRYIGKMVWPSHLAVLYPHPLAWPVWQVAVAAAVLLGLSWAAIRLARRHPYVAVGWFWYLGTLVPVIGLIQVGEQALADRYTYIPMIGLFIVLAWGIWEIAASWPERDFRLGSVAVLVVMVLAVGTRIQLQYWRTGRVLLEHSLKAGGGSGVIHGNLGVILAEEGNFAEAERHYAEALRLNPGYVRARLGLVMVLAQEGKMAEATNAVRNMEPAWEAEARRQLGESFLDRMKVSEAIEQYSAAARLDPTNAPIRERLGLTLAQAGKTAEATEQFAALVRLRPDAQAHYYLALSLVASGQAEQAAEHYREALRLKPDWPEALNDLAWLLATCPRPELRQPAEAVQLAERACALSGHHEARFLGTLDAAYAAAGRLAEAITAAEETRRVALAAQDQAVADAAAERLELYRAGRPYHQP